MAGLFLFLLFFFVGTGTCFAHTVANRLSMHAFVKPEGQRLHLLVRVPLAYLPAVELPKRGASFIDLARADQPLELAVATAGGAFTLRADGEPLSAPLRSTRRFTPPSDRAFESYEAALALLEGPPLHPGIDVPATQGYVDFHHEYKLRSDRADFTLEVHPAKELGERLVVDVRFLPPGGAERIYVLRGASGPVTLDPSWHQAAWTFIKSGVVHILGGFDHLLFLLCLVLPFRRLGWKLVGVITAFTVAHSITLISAAFGFIPSGEWFPPLVETLIAASIIYMAAENLLGASLLRRWVVTAIFGLVHGFGFSFALAEELQFAGGHLLLSLLAFNVGIEIGQIACVAAVLPVLALVARRPLASRYFRVGLSAGVALIAGYWLVERVQALGKVAWPAAASDGLMAAAQLLSAVLILGGLALWLVGRSARRRISPPADSPETAAGRRRA